MKVYIMEIILNENCIASLKNIDNFGQLHIEVADPKMEDTDIIAMLGPGAERVEEGVFWIRADHVRALAARDSDSEWQRSFTSMLEAVRPYGWSNEDLSRVRVHVKRHPISRSP